MSDQDSKDDRDEDEENAADAEASEDEASAAADDDEKPRRTKSRSEKLRNKAARREERERAAKKSAMTLALGIGAVALAVGAAGGWFGHVAQAKAKVRSDSAPAASGSAVAGSCGTWQEKICSSSGAQSAACMQAKGATGLLTQGTCEVALEAMPATLAKVKAERVPCESLATKLCKDLAPGSQTCSMIKERTPSFARERCEEMLKNYDQVLGEVRSMDQQQGGMQPGMPPGMPPGASPHGADDGHGH